MDIGYDTNYLSLNNVLFHELFKDATESTGQSSDQGSLRLCWDAINNQYVNGVLATVSFTVIQDIPSAGTTIDLSVVRNSTFDSDLNEVFVLSQSGTIYPISDSTPLICIPDAHAMRGEEITVEVLIENNPGIIALGLDLNYDPMVLELVSVTDHQLFPFASAEFSMQISQIHFRLCWDDAGYIDHTENGNLVTLIFHVLDTSVLDSTMIELREITSSTFRSDYSPVVFQIENGFVLIDSPQITTTTTATSSDTTTDTTTTTTSSDTTTTTKDSTTTTTSSDTTTTTKDSTTTTTSSDTTTTTTDTTTTTTSSDTTTTTTSTGTTTTTTGITTTSTNTTTTTANTTATTASSDTTTTTTSTDTTTTLTNTTTTDSTTSTEPVNPLEDDINGDGTVSVADAVLLARFISEDNTLTDDQTGKILNAKPDQDDDGLITLLDLCIFLEKLQSVK